MHTPGDWQVAGTVGEDEHLHIQTSDWGLRIVDGVCGSTRDERRANARLIAAAPDLLDALRHYYDLHHSPGASEIAPGTWAYCHANAKAAIAKATTTTQEK